MGNPLRVMDDDLTLRDLIARLNATGDYAINLGPLVRMDLAAATRRVFAAIGEPWPGPLHDIDAALIELEEAVVAIEAEEEDGGAPEWVPENALTVLDFKNGQYWFGAAEHTRAETIEENSDWGSFDDTKIVADVGVRATGSSSAACTFVLTSGASDGLLPSDGGFTCVATYSNAVTGTTGQASTQVSVLDLPGYNVEWGTTLILSLADNLPLMSLSSDSGISGQGDAGSSHVAAFTMEPGNIAGSIDGNAVVDVVSVSDNATATHIAISVSIFVPDATATAILEKLVFYAPAADAALPGLSTP